MQDKIIRHKDKGYIALPGDILFDKDVNIKCRGLYMTVMSLPDDWEFSVKGLAQIIPDGEDAIRSALKQLASRGWLSYQRTRNERGQVTGTEWHFFDKQQQTENPYRENPYMENPDKEKPNKENPTQLINQVINKPINLHTHTQQAAQTSVEEEKSIEPPSPSKQVWDSWLAEKCPEAFMRLQPLTNKQAEALMTQDRQNVCQLFLEINAKAIEYEGRSLYDVFITFNNCQFKRTKKKK